MSHPAVPENPRSVWARFPLDPRSSGDLRAGDPDRETAREIIAEAYADGQLDHDEYALRLDGVLGAHHLGQLVPLLSDLSLPAPQRPAAAFPSLGQVPVAGIPLFKRPIVRSAAFVIAVTNLVWLWTSISSGQVIYYWPMWPALGMAIAVLASVLLGNPDRNSTRDRNRDRRRDRRELE